MLKKLLWIIASLLVMVAPVYAGVDVNQADQAALDGIRGIGPSMSRRILAEREKGGSFKDWDDLQRRVKGIKEKSAQKLSGNGLTVNGQAMNGPVAKGPRDGKPKANARPSRETKVASGEGAPAPEGRHK